MDIGFDAAIQPGSSPRTLEPAPERVAPEREAPPADTVEVSARARDSVGTAERMHGDELSAEDVDRALGRIMLEAQLGLSAHSRIDESAVVHLLGM